MNEPPPVKLNELFSISERLAKAIHDDIMFQLEECSMEKEPMKKLAKSLQLNGEREYLAMQFGKIIGKNEAGNALRNKVRPLTEYANKMIAELRNKGVM